MHLQVCGGEEKGENTCARSLASPHRAGHDEARQGEMMGVGARRARE
jgi:hypothetical protein